jgi:hypothetical protein
MATLHKTRVYTAMRHSVGKQGESKHGATAPARHTHAFDLLPTKNTGLGEWDVSKVEDWDGTRRNE